MGRISSGEGNGKHASLMRRASWAGEENTLKDNRFTNFRGLSQCERTAHLFFAIAVTRSPACVDGEYQGGLST